MNFLLKAWFHQFTVFLIFIEDEDYRLNTFGDVFLEDCFVNRLLIGIETVV